MRLTFDRFRAAESHPERTPDCLGEIELAAAADGAAAPGALAHLSRCPACRSELAHLARLLGDDAVAAETARLGAAGARRWGTPLLVAAAAAVVLMVAIPVVRNGEDGTQFRDDPPVETWPAPALVTPNRAVAGTPIALRWSAIPSASQYRVTVFDEEGSVVWSEELSDTSITIPAAAGIAPRTYWWRVEARVDFDRWSASPLGELRVSGAR
ncbi:MAG TPA: hypothetical protein VF037_03570 [Gemmatimonadales bacterium]